MKNNSDLDNELNTEAFRDAVKKMSDKWMDYFLCSYFLMGLIFASFYDTWLIAFGVGGLCLIAYYLCKNGLPGSNLYQYVLGTILGVFMAQYIYQMHGMFEMHFFAFIGSAVLITYQNWKLQIPIMLVVVMHHATFSYLQNVGIDKIYFTQLDYFDLQAFIIHSLLAIFIFFICGLWSYQLKKYNEKHVTESMQIGLLRKEALIHIEREQNAQALENAYLRAEKSRLEAELANRETEQVNKDLERKNKELEQFAYVASHDLQEPLRTTSSFVELLQKQYSGKLDEKADKYLTYIVQSSDRMKVLINDLLEYSRIGSKKELKQIDCNTVLDETLADLGTAIKQAGAEIMAKQLPVISGYYTEIKQLFQNLIINAVKFRRIGVSLVINISAQRKKHYWQFAFADNGIGIPKQHNERIFVIFQRLYTRNEYPGSGIGLSHCKKIVELHHGQIWVDSIPGEGSTFYFTLAAHHADTQQNEIL